MALTWARNGLWALLVLLLGGGLSYFTLVGKPTPEPGAAPDVDPVRVEVVSVHPQQRSLPVYTQGTVRPLREIQLVSQVGGRVESVSERFAEGAFFAADELLVKIEDVDYQFAIARAESQVAAAQQRVAEEEGRALQAKREWRDLGTDRANSLFLRKPQIASARAALRAAEADLDAARLDLSRTAIKGPFNGRVAQKHVDVGQFVSPGTAVATVYDTDVALIRLPLKDRQVALLNLPLNYTNDQSTETAGSAVTLRARFAGREWEWQGEVVRTDATIDENSRVVYAVVEVDEPFARDPASERPPLAPGLFVNATIKGKVLADVVELPRTALRTDGSVMTVAADQSAQPRPVRVLDSDARRIWVQGLGEGERVITSASMTIFPGMEIATRPAAASTAAAAVPELTRTPGGEN